MSITDELRRMLDQSKRGLDMESLERLRRYVNEHTNTDWEYATFPPQRQLVNCTDTAVYALIDAVENEVVSMRNLAWNEGYDMGFTSADKLAADRENALAEHGWYRALCADRKPMLLGDRMEWTNGTFTIHELKFTEGGCTTWDSEHGYTVHADECHHHEPTVEDVLREFAEQYAFYSAIEGGIHPGLKAHEEVLRQFAAKLRLAGDGE